MEEYKGNSHRSKENAIPEKHVEKVVTGEVKTKKKSELRKFTDVFIADDVSKVKNYILDEVLIPSFKKAIDDIITNGIKILLWGETGRKSNSSSKISYRSYYERENERRDYSRIGSRRTMDYDDIIIPTRAEAEEVLDKLDELIDTYNVASIADLYDLVGITGDYTSNKYGWTNLANSTVVRVRDGYMLKLPRALPLN